MRCLLDIGINCDTKKFRRKFQFFVGTDILVRSALWNVIATDNDMYLTSTAFGSCYKMSFHASGVCHSAITSEYVRQHPMPNQQRYFAKWKLATRSQFADVVFYIVVPYNQMNNFFGTEYPDAGFVAIPAPQTGQYCMIYIYKIQKIRDYLPVVNMEMLQEPYKIVERFPGPEGQSKFALIEMPDGSGYLFTYSYVKKTSVQERELAKTIASSIRDHVLIIDNKRRAGFLQLKSFDNYNGILIFYY